MKFEINEGERDLILDLLIKRKKTLEKIQNICLENGEIAIEEIAADEKDTTLMLIDRISYLQND